MAAVGKSLVVVTKRRISPSPRKVNSKKPRQGGKEESDEDDNDASEEDSSDDESEDESEEESTEIAMPKEGNKNSKLKCMEIKGRAHVWSAFVCEPEHKQWHTLQSTPWQ